MNIIPFKVVLLGESSVGKSSLALAFVKNYFDEFQEITVGAAYLSKIVVIDKIMIKLEIWDTAGQEKFHSLAPIYYRGAHAALALYDITNTQSFHKAKNYIKEMKEKYPFITVIALGGNKSDLDDKREVCTPDAQEFANEMNLLFMEMSSKTLSNVHEIFNQLGIQKRTEHELRIITSLSL